MAFLPSPPEKHKGILWACAIALAAFAAVAVRGEHGLLDLLRLRAEQGELERSAFELQQENQQLRKRIDKLTSDDRTLEELARRRAGLVKPGELVYRPEPKQPRR